MVAALSICLVVAALFIGDALHVALLGTVVAALFVLSMLALIAALILFLLEVRLTTRLLEERLLESRDTRSKHS